MNIYVGKLPVYHFDLYRVEGKELPNIGYEEFFYGQGVSVIEWAERLGDQMPKEYICVTLEHAGENERRIALAAKGKSLGERLEKLK
jgi:tRNA threonylcarbamoyladenosine biosynthesis protein TsaE